MTRDRQTTHDSGPSVPSRSRDLAAPEWLVGGGEMGERIRAADWSATACGPRDRWPQPLRTILALLVESRVPMCLLWGPELLVFYNDGYRPIAADRDGLALGRARRELWPEAWRVDGPIVEAVLRGEGPVHLEDQLRRVVRDGKEEDATFAVHYGAVRAEDGAIAGTLITLQETTAAVTRRRESEAALHELNATIERRVAERTARLRDSEALLRALTEHSPDAIYVKDTQSRWLLANPAVLRIIERTAEEALGKTDLELYRDPAIGRAILENDRRIMRQGRPEAVEEIADTPEGRRVFLSIKAPWPDGRGGVAGIVGVSHDITQQKQTETALRASEERLRALVAASSDAVYRVSPDFEELLLLRGQDLDLGADRPSPAWLDTYIPTADQPQVREVIQEAIRAKSTIELEHRILRADGSVGWAFSRAVPLQDAQGEILEWFGTATDITDRKQVEEELRHANARLTDADQRKNEFLAALSHELRNPLAPITNSLYVLDRASPDGEQAARARQISGRQVRQLSGLVDDLLDVTRITRGKAKLQPEQLDLGEVVRRAVEDNRSLFDRAGVRLELTSEARAIRMMADPIRIAQIVGNLLQNSAKFTARGGVTRVSVAVEGRQGVVRVADDGMGIARETLERLFQPFTQAEQTLDRSRGGLGLGLALVKGLVELHGGSVSAHSEGPGRGTEMVIRLPVETSAAPQVAEAFAEADRRPRRILIIEDNADAAASLREVLALRQHEVEVAQDGPEGLALARRFHPEVVLCDIGLPGMSGYDVARAFRAEEALRGTALVALTGYALPEDVQRAAEAGFAHHLAKPPSLEKLETLLAGLPTERAASSAEAPAASHGALPSA